MLKLSKKDRNVSLIVVVVCLLVSYFSRSFFYIKTESIITILTVIMGFILSAIAIIFSSSLRKELYDQKSKGYVSLWHTLISISYSIFKFNLLFVGAIAILPACAPNWIIMGLFINSIVELIFVIHILFRLLSVEIV